MEKDERQINSLTYLFSFLHFFWRTSSMREKSHFIPTLTYVSSASKERLNESKDPIDVKGQSYTYIKMYFRSFIFHVVVMAQRVKGTKLSLKPLHCFVAI